MVIKLDVAEVGLLISALTEMRLHLHEQRKLFLETKRPDWAAHCDVQLLQVAALKERFME